MRILESADDQPIPALRVSPSIHEGMVQQFAESERTGFKPEPDPVLTSLANAVRTARESAQGLVQLASAAYADASIPRAAAAIAAIRAERKTTAIQSSLRSGLMSEGVKPTLANAAAALMGSAFRFEVEEADDGDGSTVLVHTDFGLHSVADAVRAFLQSDDGAPFRSGRQIAAGGMFSAMMATLRHGI